MMGTRTRDRIVFISSLLLFGSNGIVAAHIDMPSDGIVFFRTFLGAALLVVVCIATHRRFRFLRSKRDLLLVGLSGAAMGASWIFLYEAYRLVGVGISSIAYYCAPVIVMALSPLLFHERLTGYRLLGFAIVFAGAILIEVRTVGGGGSSWGMFCGWMSALMHAVMVIASKKADHVDGLESSAFQLVVSFFVVAVWVVVRGELPFPVVPGQWGWLLTLGLVNTGLGCYLYFSSYRGLTVQSVAILGYLEPLSAVALAALLLGETMTAAQLVGAAMVLAGALFGELAGARPARRLR